MLSADEKASIGFFFGFQTRVNPNGLDTDLFSQAGKFGYLFLTDHQSWKRLTSERLLPTSFVHMKERGSPGLNSVTISIHRVGFPFNFLYSSDLYSVVHAEAIQETDFLFLRNDAYAMFTMTILLMFSFRFRLDVKLPVIRCFHRGKKVRGMVDARRGSSCSLVKTFSSLTLEKNEFPLVRNTADVESFRCGDVKVLCQWEEEKKRKRNKRETYNLCSV